MEHFYYVKEDSELAKQYWEHRKTMEKYIIEFNDFAQEVGITTVMCYPSTNRLHIGKPTESDIEKFGAEMTKEQDGLFKKSSPTNKAWVQRCKDKGITYIEKPYLPNVFRANNTFSNETCYFRLFDVNNRIFATFSCQDDIETPDELIEMKGSEFYTIMESYHIQL